eukprot:scaffold29_cov251-Pinguiococcus_pyrenoidosus.AAC.10
MATVRAWWLPQEKEAQELKCSSAGGQLTGTPAVVRLFLRSGRVFRFTAAMLRIHHAEGQRALHIVIRKLERRRPGRLELGLGLRLGLSELRLDGAQVANRHRRSRRPVGHRRDGRGALAEVANRARLRVPAEKRFSSRRQIRSPLLPQ